MKYRLILCVILLACIGAWLPMSPRPVQAAAPQANPAAEPFPGQSLCLPETDAPSASPCLALGPAQTLADLAKQGIQYPISPLPASKPGFELTNIPVMIARINMDKALPVDIYSSLDDAAAGKNPVRQIAAGVTRYVSYVQTQKINGKPFVQLHSGEWVRASPSSYPLFQGLTFRRTPTVLFGWMLDSIKPYVAPGFAQKQAGDTLAKWSVIQIAETAQADGMDWYRVGTDQWVPWLKARRLHINTTPPKDVTGDRWIEVNLFDQTLSVYDNRQLVFATLIASGGEPLYTRPGLFHVKDKHETYTMQGATNADRSDYYYLEDVPWTMFFDDARALHGAYWRAWFGYPGTHGCVNLSVGDSAWLFQWANVGDWVYVWDPSGKTPVDPSLYGPGGA